MSKRTWLLLAATASMLVMAIGASDAGANERIGLSVSSGRLESVTAESRAFTFAEEGIFGVTCELVSTLSLSRSIAKSAGALFGQITRIEASGCRNGSVRLLTGALPWNVTYQSFTGTLPDIESLRVAMTGMAILMETTLGLTRCLFRGSPQATTDGEGTITELSVDPTVTIPLSTQLGGICPASIAFRGTLRLSPSVRMLLRGSLAVSLGDSYISGEGGRWAGNTFVNGAESTIDALGESAYTDAPAGEFCHRSTSAQIHIGERVTGVNYACSGATVETRLELFKPGLDTYNREGRQSQVVMLEQLARAHSEIRLVAISIGANDFSVPTVITECYRSYIENTGRCSTVRRIETYFERREAETVTRAIQTALENVDRAMTGAGYRHEQYKLIVQNYPSPITEERAARFAAEERVVEETEGGEEAEEAFERYIFGKRRQWMGGCGFYDADLGWARTTVIPTMNTAITEAANAAEAATGSTILRLDVAAAFDQRRLCERAVNLMDATELERWDQAEAPDEVEWVSRVWPFFGEPYLWQESVHPNFWGQMALRNCLRRAYNPGGAPRGGTCARNGTGMDERREPRMRF